MSPIQLLTLWLRGLLAVAVIAASIWLWREWHEQTDRQPSPPPTVGADDNAPRPERDYLPGWNHPTALLTGAIATSLWALGGGLLFQRIRRPTGDHSLNHRRTGHLTRIPRADNTHITVESDGPPDAPTLLLSHGWGVDSAEWNAHRQLWLDRGLRLVMWDSPGLGQSDRPSDHNISLPRLAADLKTVLEFAGATGRVVLVGHSAGAMTALEFCRQYPDLARDRVAGIVLAHGTYTNPLRTMRRGSIYTALQKPVVEPLLHLSAALSPVLRLLAWISYLQGSAHRSTSRSGFSGRETWGKLDFVARYHLGSNPAVVARGALGMIHWDASDVPPRLPAPTLVVTGRRDPTTLPEAGDHIRQQAPQSEDLRFEAGKHQGLIEFNDDFASRVATFALHCLGTAEPHPEPRDTTNAARPGLGREEIGGKSHPDQSAGLSGGAADEHLRDRNTMTDRS